MDAKALAKSKRAHSLHHSKKHNPSKTSSKGSVTATTSKKPDSKGEKQKSPQSHGSRALPSNWDRYEDEYYDAGIEDVAHSSVGQTLDVVMPKSKGADYAHLIFEAKEQSHSSYSVDSFTLFNDILDEFNQGLGPLLLSRGQHLASSRFNDNFLLDDKESCSHEAPFLSLNLHCLAEQLEKISLAERIFIQPDLLPREMSVELQENTGGEPRGQTASVATGAVEVVSDGACSNAFSREKLKVHQSSDSVTSDSNKRICNSDPTSTSEGFLDNAVDSLWELNEATNSTSGNFTSDLTTDSTSKKPSIFDAGGAEEELDLLLDSLGETKRFDSSVVDQRSDNTYVPQGLSNQSTYISRSIKESRGLIASNIDDDIDNLLSETSDLINKKRTSHLHQTKDTSAGASSTTTTTVPDSTSKILDDFDSWLDAI